MDIVFPLCKAFGTMREPAPTDLLPPLPVGGCLHRARPVLPPINPLIYNGMQSRERMLIQYRRIWRSATAQHRGLHGGFVHQPLLPLVGLAGFLLPAAVDEIAHVLALLIQLAPLFLRPRDHIAHELDLTALLLDRHRQAADKGTERLVLGG